MLLICSANTTSIRISTCMIIVGQGYFRHYHRVLVSWVTETIFKNRYVKIYRDIFKWEKQIYEEIEKRLSPFPRHGERFTYKRRQSKISNYNLSSDIKTFFNYLSNFSLQYQSNKCQQSLKSFKEKWLQLLGHQAPNQQCNNFQKI